MKETGCKSKIGLGAKPTLTNCGGKKGFILSAFQKVTASNTFLVITSLCKTMSGEYSNHI